MDTAKKMVDGAEFSKRLKARRKELGLTQAEVAEKAGMARQQYSNYERNIVTRPGLNICAAMALALETTVDALMVR